MSCPRCGFCITEEWGERPEGDHCPLCYAEKGLTVAMKPWSFADLRREREQLLAAHETSAGA